MNGCEFVLYCLPLSVVFLLDFGAVPTVLYFCFSFYYFSSIGSHASEGSCISVLGASISSRKNNHEGEGSYICVLGASISSIVSHENEDSCICVLGYRSAL